MEQETEVLIIKAELRAADIIDPHHEYVTGPYLTKLQDMYDLYGNPAVNEAIRRLEKEDEDNLNGI